MRRLRPFFQYYGGKWKASRRYPSPRHNTIIEPFAGAAGYSINHAIPARNVILCDLDEVICGIWSFLIRATPAEIISLPDLRVGDSTDDLDCCKEARDWIGFWTQGPVSSPGKKFSSFAIAHPDRFWGEKIRRRTAAQLEYIRHWQIHQCTYTDVPFCGPATWFVDPPYQDKGIYYTKSSRSIDFAVLGAWCRQQPGQVIVCENEGATWLPFRRLYTMSANSSAGSKKAGKRKTEVVWINNVDDEKFIPQPENDRQISMFPSNRHDHPGPGREDEEPENRGQ